MTRVKVVNLMNYPMDLEGGLRLPAMDSVTDDFDDQYIAALRLSPGVEVRDVEQPVAAESGSKVAGSKQSKQRLKPSK